MRRQWGEIMIKKRAGKLTEKVLKLFMATGNEDILSFVHRLNIKPTLTPVLPTKDPDMDGLKIFTAFLVTIIKVLLISFGDYRRPRQGMPPNPKRWWKCCKLRISTVKGHNVDRAFLSPLLSYLLGFDVMSFLMIVLCGGVALVLLAILLHRWFSPVVGARTPVNAKSGRLRIV
ncbi:hypothetical protein C4D60_Mb08t05710 [Musa balbisiana]|uniref:Uncharacterized protein n=1 Tax=Musa balbisiana TaxID=52838 RepID=A0A4S8K1N3_MUSBA|nr:hypothetical protein C4D60_Mb08t05710 [Musa balbisiana]